MSTKGKRFNQIPTAEARGIGWGCLAQHQASRVWGKPSDSCYPRDVNTQWLSVTGPCPDTTCTRLQTESYFPPFKIGCLSMCGQRDNVGRSHGGASTEQNQNTGADTPRGMTGKGKCSRECPEVTANVMSEHRPCQWTARQKVSECLPPRCQHHVPSLQTELEIVIVAIPHVSQSEMPPVPAHMKSSPNRDSVLLLLLS